MNPVNRDLPVLVVGSPAYNVAAMAFDDESAETAWACINPCGRFAVGYCVSCAISTYTVDAHRRFAKFTYSMENLFLDMFVHVLIFDEPIAYNTPEWHAMQVELGIVGKPLDVADENVPVPGHGGWQIVGPGRLRAYAERRGRMMRWEEIDRAIAEFKRQGF